MKTPEPTLEDLVRGAANASMQKKCGRKNMPVESKRTARSLRCAPAAWASLACMAKKQGLNIGQILDQMVERIRAKG